MDCSGEPFHTLIQPNAGTIDADGYRVEIWGHVGDPQNPAVLIRTAAGELWGHVDRARVRYLADPPLCWLEAERNEASIFEVQLVGIERCADEHQAHRALSGMRLLVDLIENSRRVRHANFWSHVEEAARHVRSNHTALTVETLLIYLPMARSTFYAWMEELHLTWPAVKANLRRANHKERTKSDT